MLAPMPRARVRTATAVKPRGFAEHAQAVTYILAKIGEQREAAASGVAGLDFMLQNRHGGFLSPLRVHQFVC